MREIPGEQRSRAQLAPTEEGFELWYAPKKIASTARSYGGRVFPIARVVP